MVKNSTDAMKDSRALDYANMVIILLFVITDRLNLINLLPKKNVMIRVVADCLLVDFAD